MNFRSTLRKWIDYFREDTAVIRESLGLKSFLARPDFKKGSVGNMVKKRARHLKGRMGVPLDHQWEPRIMENEKKVVKMKRRAR
jgi:hypothetical protein